MSLWMLEPIENCPRPDPWSFPYDVALGFVVRAETEQPIPGTAGDPRSVWCD